MTSLRSDPQIPPQLATGMGLPPRASAVHPMSDDEVARNVEHVVDHGYVFIPAYFPVEATQPAREQVERQLLAQLSKRRYAKFAPFELEESAAFASLLFDRNLIRILAGLLGPGVRLSHSAGVVHKGKHKVALHGGPTPDNVAYPKGSSVAADEVSYGVWLTPQQERQGIAVLPDSHRGPFGRSGREVFKEDLSRNWDDARLYSPALPAGSVGFWAEALVHGAIGKPSSPRLTLYGHACAGNRVIFAPGMERLPPGRNAEEARLLREPWRFVSGGAADDQLRQRLISRPPTLHEPFCKWLEENLKASPWLEPLRPASS